MSASQWVSGLARPYRQLGIIATIAAIVSTGLLMVPAALTRLLVNNVLIGGHFSRLWDIIGLAVTASVVRGSTTYLQAYLSETMGQSILRDLRTELFAHLTHLSYSYYDGVQSGQLISRLTSDVEWVRMYYSNFFTQGSTVLFTLIFIISSITALDWHLGIILLLLMPGLAYLVHRFNRRVRPAFGAIRAEFAVMTTLLQENASGVRVVKSFGQEPSERQKFDQSLDRLFHRNLDATRLWAKYFPLFDLTAGLYGVIVLLYGGYQTIHGNISVGSLVAISAYAMMMVTPLRELGQVLNLRAQSAAGTFRLFELRQQIPTIVSPCTSVSPRAMIGTIEFDHVSLRYPGMARNALNNISFNIGPGQVLAIVGATGSGKTSIVSLLARLYDVTEGAVRVDGLDVRKWPLQELRRQIAYVPQETFLFSATVRENIAYGRPDASYDEVVEAAIAAQAHDFITALPRQYETLVGERGIGLSGGQRQRLAIARALLLKTPIVVLDDATASVDQETEVNIQAATAQLLAERTTIVIGHRLASLQAADLILVVSDGAIVQKGRHNELLSQPGLYRDLYQIQTQDQRELAKTGGLYD